MQILIDYWILQTMFVWNALQIRKKQVQKHNLKWFTFIINKNGRRTNSMMSLNMRWRNRLSALWLRYWYASESLQSRPDKIRIQSEESKPKCCFLHNLFSNLNDFWFDELWIQSCRNQRDWWAFIFKRKKQMTLTIREVCCWLSMQTTKWEIPRQKSCILQNQQIFAYDWWNHQKMIHNQLKHLPNIWIFKRLLWRRSCWLI